MADPSGKVYLFTSEYTGTPRGLSRASGIVGVASELNPTDNFYSFAPTLEFLPNTQYFLYADTRPGGPGGVTITNHIYPDGYYYNSPNGNGNFGRTPYDTAFSLQGTSVAAPAPLLGSGLSGLAVLAVFLFAGRAKLRLRRA